MPRQSKKKTPGKWFDQLDETDVQEAMDEACVDAYDEHEQYSGLATMAHEQIEFPFPAKVLGEDVEVIDIEWPEDDPFGLDLVCQRSDGKQFPIEARCVELQPPLPEGHLYLAAYLAWKRTL